MNEAFRQKVEVLDPALEQLVNMEPATVTSLPTQIPKAGVYLFSEGAKHLYVGRTKSLRSRLQSHCRPSSGHNSATLAFRMARETTGQTEPTYRPEGSRADLQKDPAFADAFAKAKQRVRNMEVRFVAEAGPMRQALLEIYVALALDTPYNDFDTH